MVNLDWKELYDKKKRPQINELRAYFTDEVFGLFSQYCSHMAQNYGLGCAPADYNATNGWTFRIGKNGVYLVSGLRIADGCFYIRDIAVRDDENLKSAIIYTHKLYADGFVERYNKTVEEKKAKQIEQTKRRLEREKQELLAMKSQIIPEKFNKYHWSQKVSRRDLIRLYKADAKMLFDEDLVDEIGITLYARCIQGRDVWLDIDSGKLKCHNCGNILLAQRGLMTCTCGYQYLFREYMRSFRKENMPSGAATHIFNAFIKNWEKVKVYHEKMRLIDELIHEFHINLVSGIKGRFVGINLIDGSKKQIGDLILTLAYGDDKESVMETFKKNFSKET
ncbi:MAG: hypothetical protein K0R50_2773 [Eubacterium sp.]|jgi:hypothetical protein|nr:hypothetical protein [Eubacterium sp.]